MSLTSGNQREYLRSCSRFPDSRSLIGRDAVEVQMKPQHLPALSVTRDGVAHFAGYGQERGARSRQQRLHCGPLFARQISMCREPKSAGSRIRLVSSSQASGDPLQVPDRIPYAEKRAVRSALPGGGRGAGGRGRGAARAGCGLGRLARVIGEGALPSRRSRGGVRARRVAVGGR